MSLRVHTPNYHMAIKISQGKKHKKANLTYLIPFTFHNIGISPLIYSLGEEFLELFSQKIAIESRTTYRGSLVYVDTLGIRLPIDFAIFYQIAQSTSGTESYSECLH